MHKIEINIIMKDRYMKNKILILLLIFIIILIFAGYTVYHYRTTTAKAQEINEEYKQYYHTQVLGNELISIINKTIDLNQKNGITKNEEGLFQENDTNSIKLYVKLQYQDDYTTVEMEKIADNGIENFIKVYNSASFECTEITYHAKNNNMKTIIFTEVVETED